MDQIYAAKTFVVEFSGLDRDALHIYVALATYFGSCLILGWRAWQWRVLLMVLAVTVAGEYVDLRHYMKQGWPITLANNIHDIWNTMLAPILLFLAAKLTKMFDKPEPSTSETSDLGDELEV